MQDRLSSANTDLDSLQDDMQDVSDTELDDFDPLLDMEFIEQDEPEIAGGSDSDDHGDDHGEVHASAADSHDSVRLVYIVPDEERRSSHMMTQAEATRSIALRAKQIADNLVVFIEMTKDLTQASKIAEREFHEHRSPLILRRLMSRTAKGEAIIEKWRVRDMSYPTMS